MDQDNPNYQITSYVYNNYYFSTDSGKNFIQRVDNQPGYFINPAVWDSQQDILYSCFTLGKGGKSTPFTTPETGIVYNTGLRIRVVSAYSTIPANASATGLYGQAEDYTAYFIASALPVQLTEFKADCKE